MNIKIRHCIKFVSILCNFIYYWIIDVIFFIFLYQRWIYPIDPKRINEFGVSGEDLARQPDSNDNELTPTDGENKKDK